MKRSQTKSSIKNIATSSKYVVTSASPRTNTGNAKSNDDKINNITNNNNVDDDINALLKGYKLSE